MDSDSNNAIYVRTFTTALAAFHLCLSPILKLSYGYAPVLFACFLSIVLPYFLLAVKVKKLLKKEDFQVTSRTLKFLTRNRFITWDEIQYSIDIFLGSTNLFAVYANFAVRARTGDSGFYFLVPSALSFFLCLSFFLDSSFAFHRLKLSTVTGNLTTRSTKTKTRLDKFMNFLAERLIVVQFPILILLIIWHSTSLSLEEQYLYGSSLYAANLIQYPLIFMMIVFFHGRLVRWAQRKLSRFGLHVYGIQYTILLIISGFGLSSLVLNLELLHQKYYGIVYIAAPYATFVISMTQAFALAGHDAWKNYKYSNDEKMLVQPNLNEMIEISTINPENLVGEDRVEEIHDSP